MLSGCVKHAAPVGIDCAARIADKRKPPGIFTERERLRQTEGRPLYDRSVLRFELFDENVHRPTITDNVMRGENERVLVGGEREQRGSHQRACDEVKRRCRILLDGISKGHIPVADLSDFDRSIRGNLRLFLRHIVTHFAL